MRTRTTQLEKTICKLADLLLGNLRLVEAPGERKPVNVELLKQISTTLRAYTQLADDEDLSRGLTKPGIDQLRAHEASRQAVMDRWCPSANERTLFLLKLAKRLGQDTYDVSEACEVVSGCIAHASAAWLVGCTEDNEETRNYLKQSAFLKLARLADELGEEAPPLSFVRETAHEEMRFCLTPIDDDE